MYAIVYNYMLSGDTIFRLYLLLDNSDCYFKATQSNVQCQWFFRTFSRWRVPMNPMVPEFVIGKIYWLGPFFGGSKLMWNQHQLCSKKKSCPKIFFISWYSWDQSKFLNRRSWFGFPAHFSRFFRITPSTLRKALPCVPKRPPGPSFAPKPCRPWGMGCGFWWDIP